jgi:hypothetical protein
MTLPYGRVLHDYLDQNADLARAPIGSSGQGDLSGEGDPMVAAN